MTVDLEHNRVQEIFKGEYNPTYNINNTRNRCDCSEYARCGICRHIIYLRRIAEVPIFDASCFHKSLIKPEIDATEINMPAMTRPLSPTYEEECEPEYEEPTEKSKLSTEYGRFKKANDSPH